LSSIPEARRHEVGRGAQAGGRWIEEFGAGWRMVNAQGIPQTLQIVFNLGEALLESIVLGHVHAHLLGSFVKLQQVLAVTNFGQNVLLLSMEFKDESIFF
jgi:hypothetical protein